MERLLGGMEELTNKVRGPAEMWRGLGCEGIGEANREYVGMVMGCGGIDVKVAGDIQVNGGPAGV